MIGIILLVVYLLVLVGMGIWGMRRTRTLGDFFLGNRTIGPWISAFAYGTTYFSAVIFIGFAGKLGWGFGLNVMWIALGNAVIGALAAWLVLGRRTRRMTQNLSAMTMPEFLHVRFGGGPTRVIAALVIFVFLLPYSASIFKGLSHLFEAVFNIPYDAALIIMIAITGLYLILGGYFAVTITDFFQGIIMLGGAALLVAFVIGRGGGIAASISTAAANYAAHVPAGKGPSTLLLVGLVFMTSFGPWGLPQMVQKFYAVKNEKVIIRAAIVTFVFALVIAGAAYFNGALMHLFTDRPPLLASGKADYDRLIPDVLVQVLPAWLLALILLLVLAASMSTLSSLVLVSASAIAIDLYPNQQRQLPVLRMLSGVFVVISWVIARFQVAAIVTLMSLAWGVVAGAFMAPLLFGLYWRRATRAGVVSGMVVGAATAIVLFFVMGEANSPIASSIAMVVPFAVVPLVSLASPPPAKEILDRAFDGI